MFQKTLETDFHRFMNFLGFAKSFLIRKNPLASMSSGFVEIIKDFLTMKKKLKLSQYRLHYHNDQLRKMESLIAENNEHAFLKGKKINEVR